MWQLTGSGTGPYEIQDDVVNRRVAILNHVSLADAEIMTRARELDGAGRTLAAYLYSIVNPGTLPPSVRLAMRSFEG